MTASRAPDNTLTTYYYDDYGALYALERGGVRYYVGSDHLGTPKVITDNTGAVKKSWDYDSWGNRTVLTDNDPTLDLPVGFAGGIPDDAAGLVRFGLRDYEPGTGRWTAKDPIFFYGGQFNLYSYVDSVGKPHFGGANLYQYSNSNPVNYFDRNGLDYTDINVSFGILGGFTAGVMITPEGEYYPYLGAGLMASPGISVTWSPSDPATGNNVAFQAGWFGGGQAGYGLEDGGLYGEAGFVTPGASLTGFRVWGPFGNKKKGPECP